MNSESLIIELVDWVQKNIEQGKIILDVGEFDYILELSQQLKSQYGDIIFEREEALAIVKKIECYLKKKYPHYVIESYKRSDSDHIWVFDIYFVDYDCLREMRKYINFLQDKYNKSLKIFIHFHIVSEENTLEFYPEIRRNKII